MLYPHKLFKIYSGQNFSQTFLHQTSLHPLQNREEKREWDDVKKSRKNRTYYSSNWEGTAASIAHIREKEIVIGDGKYTADKSNGDTDNSVSPILSTDVQSDKFFLGD